MKKSPVVTTVESKVPLLATALENHINESHHPDKGGNRNVKINEDFFLHDFINIKWCSEHLPAEGTVEISFSTDDKDHYKCVSIPVATSFWIVCTKQREENYKVTWSCSLS